MAFRSNLVAVKLFTPLEIKTINILHNFDTTEDEASRQTTSVSEINSCKADRGRLGEKKDDPETA